jgi:NAD(P)-dependent dehydrogenase (short-subunit alcohol dehydrogenase family)
MSVLLVTGGSRGIGAEICRVAASKGWAVAVNYARSRDEADAVVADITKAGGKAIAVQADVSSSDDVESMFTVVDEQLGPISALINNAGIMGSTGPVDEMDVGLTSRIFEVNIMGPFLCASAAIRRMSKKHGGDGGVIVNISSAAAKHGGAGSYVDYAATKGAVDVFTVGLAREQAVQGIRVNCVRPGATMTEMNYDWMKEHPEWLDWVMAQVPLKRPGEVREIADAALWLISDESSYVTGAILDVCGGWVSP